LTNKKGIFGGKIFWSLLIFLRLDVKQKTLHFCVNETLIRPDVLLVAQAKIMLTKKFLHKNYKLADQTETSAENELIRHWMTNWPIIS